MSKSNEITKEQWQEKQCPNCHGYADGTHSCDTRWVTAKECRKRELARKKARDEELLEDIQKIWKEEPKDPTMENVVKTRIKIEKALTDTKNLLTNE